MSLFKKKKEVKNTVTCACGSTCGESKADAKAENCCCGKSVDGICCIKVLGAGCSSCHQMYENAKEAAKNKGLGIEVEYITDMQIIVSYGVMTVPALVVNDRVVSMGKLLKSADIEKYL